jgi:phosphohistidine swiveling domain-containing protein
MSSTEVMQRPAPAPIAAPANFPVTWKSPDDEKLTWTHDRMHNPDPLLPLERLFWDTVYLGFNRAAEAYEMANRVKARAINTYYYMALQPAVPPEDMEAQGKRADARIDAAMARLGELWREEWLPEIQSHLTWWEAFDLRAATAPALQAHLEETLRRTERLWELHFRIVLPAYMAMSQFDDLYRDLFAGDGALRAYRLLQGFDNKTLEAGWALWDLSRRALRAPEVRRALEGQTAESALAELEKTAAGRAFRAELQIYLETFGLRGEKWGLSYSSWIEDPAPVIKNLQDYIARSDQDPRKEQAVLAAERDRAVAEAREGLQGYPHPIVERFEFLLKAAHQGAVLSEDHGFWIDFASTYMVRRVLLECGRRLAEAHAIAQPADVFYLTLEELRGLVAAPSPANHRSRVAERQAEVVHFRAISPPPALGTDNGPPPDDPLGRFFGKLFGGPPPAPEAPNLLRGNAGSPGKVRGPAKVVRSLAETTKLRQGDVLVAETTAPPWTPLFATAAAIVTDTGGILSHCAVVAREYRIPAVVGTGRATAEIRDGQILEVDGDAGLVRIDPA